MTAENKSSRKFSFRKTLMVLPVLAGLFLLSLTSGRKSAEVEGPLRLVRGPNDTVYVQIDRSIAKVSSDGEVLGLIDLETDASLPDIADFFVERDGRLLFARKDASLLQYYSSEGKMLATLLHILPASALKNNSYKLTKDATTGVLYLADTPRNRIQIFGPDGKERKTVTAPYGAQPSPFRSERMQESGLERIYSSKTPLQDPQGLTFAADRLIAADTGNSRIVLFYPDGSLDKIIPVFPLERSNFINPVKADRSGDTIYVVVRGRGFGGEVQSFEFNTGLPRKFSYPASGDPQDILARTDDVLVADRASLAVMRYTHSGRFLGTFGKADLQGLYAFSQAKRKTYEWIRKGSLAGMAAALGWLIFTSAGGLTADHLRKLLGPPHGLRRKMLLLVPGLGQAAAGRPLRTGILLIIFCYCAGLFIYSWFQYHSGPGALPAQPMLITAAFIAYSVWISIVLDGIRLAARPPETGRVERPSYAVFVPLVTVCSAAAAQLAREFLVQAYPAAPSSIEQLFYFLITSIRGHSALSSVALPASILFGWGGAGGALFGTFAWQAEGRRPEIATGIVAGFLAGMYGWLFTAVIAGNGLGWMQYALPVQGFLLSLFAWLYFRRKGMPPLVMPAAVAGAWVGYLLKFLFGVLAALLSKISAGGDAGGFWTGAVARLELIFMPAFFIHIAIRITWTITSDRPAEVVEAVERKEEPFLVSSHSR